MKENVQLEQEAFRDRLATVDASGKRVWLFPRKPKGLLYNWRGMLSVVYLVVFFGLPFLRIAGHPVFLFNFPERRFILFGQIFWPQDFFIFALGALLFIVFIALFTVVFGRVFCGWACPQTIFMEMVFRRIEYWIEGDGPAQKVLKAAPWTRMKILKKLGKWTAFWVLSFVIANLFLAYIIGTDALKAIIAEPVARHTGGFLSIILFTSVFFFVYSWFREQVCTVVCPYGRLQGVLLDRNSIVVAYDYRRGEPRGKFRKSSERTAGDCIDCHQCVQVCPTGIDIRHGTQLECVNCTACIDACNRMMNAVGLEPNLIRYASENSLAEGRKPEFDLRMKAYSAVMLILLLVEGMLLATRKDLSAAVVRTPGQLYQERANAEISNLYNLKLINKTFQDKTVWLMAEDFNGRVDMIGADSIHIPAGGDAAGEFFIFRPASEVTGRNTRLHIGVYDNGQRLQRIELSFVGPFRMDG